MVDADSSALKERRVVVLVARAVSYLVYAYLIVVEIILLMGFLLLLFGANPSAGFTEWVYRNLDRVMEPFRGIFTSVELGVGGNEVESIFETSVLFAMIIYGILALLLSGLIGLLTNRLHQIEGAEAELERRENYQAQLDAIAAQQAQMAAQHAEILAQQRRLTAGTDPSAPPPGAVAPSPGVGGQQPGTPASPPQSL